MNPKHAFLPELRHDYGTFYVLNETCKAFTGCSVEKGILILDDPENNIQTTVPYQDFTHIHSMEQFIEELKRINAMKKDATDRFLERLKRLSDKDLVKDRER